MSERKRCNHIYPKGTLHKGSKVSDLSFQPYFCNICGEIFKKVKSK
jgi:hypothetical protein